MSNGNFREQLERQSQLFPMFILKGGNTSQKKKKKAVWILLWGAISGSLTRRVSATQQHRHDTALAMFASVFSPRLLTSEELGSDGWDGVTRLKIKVDI